MVPKEEGRVSGVLEGGGQEKLGEKMERGHLGEQRRGNGSGGRKGYENLADG